MKNLNISKYLKKITRKITIFFFKIVQTTNTPALQLYSYSIPRFFPEIMTRNIFFISKFCDFLKHFHTSFESIFKFFCQPKFFFRINFFPFQNYLIKIRKSYRMNRSFHYYLKMKSYLKINTDSYYLSNLKRNKLKR